MLLVHKDINLFFYLFVVMNCFMENILKDLSQGLCALYVCVHTYHILTYINIFLWLERKKRLKFLSKN